MSHASPPSPSPPPPPPALRGLLETIAREQRCAGEGEPRVTPISTGGANYTSELFLVRLAAAPGRPDLRLFAKVASINGKMREDAPITQFYDTERFVYETLVAVYAQLEEAHAVPPEHRLRFPKYYGCNPALYEETIVLEDLTARGFGSPDRLRPMGWEYACAAVGELAKLHALSFAFGAERPRECARVLEERQFRMSADDDRLKAVWERMVRAAVAATREESRPRLASYLAEHAGRMRDYYRPLRRPVLTHGDFRPSNLMHRTTPEGALEVMAVDYQTLRAGCAVTDLLYLVVAGTDADFRRQHYDALLEHYYEQLGAALRRLGHDVADLYPREDFDYELKECMPYGLMVAVFVLPLVTVEAADAPSLADTSIDEWRVKSSRLFAERLDGIVDDYVRWGIL